MTARSADMLHRKIPINQSEAATSRFISLVSGQQDNVPA